MLYKNSLLNLYFLDEALLDSCPTCLSCDREHKILKCPALTLSHNLAFNIHLNKQKYFLQVPNMSRTPAR